MSYALQFGDTQSWDHIFSASLEDSVFLLDSVYLWRATLSTPIDTSRPDDLWLVWRAATGDVVSQYGAAGIGAAVSLDGKGVDVVFAFTNSDTPTLAPFHTTGDIAKAVVNDSSVRQRYPNIGVSSSDTLQLIGPPQSIEFWKSRAFTWDTGDSGPNALGAKKAQMYIGTADDGPNLREFPTAVDPGFGKGVPRVCKLQGDAWNPTSCTCVVAPPLSPDPNLVSLYMQMKKMTCTGEGGVWKDPSTCVLPGCSSTATGVLSSIPTWAIVAAAGLAAWVAWPKKAA